MKRCIVLLVAGVFALAFPAHATIINVPADQPTIQAGIDASVDDDTVLVQPGTYVENISFNGHNITLGSLFLTTEDPSYISSTIIDGNQSGSVVSFLDGEDNNAVITGFTIQNGDMYGGIYCVSSSPTISNNIISGNSAGWGGGINCDVSSPTINYNTISGNSGGLDGGGIYCWDSNPSISYNTITGNTAQTCGGICCENYSPTISNNTISGNSARYCGGIYCSNSSPTINYNTISGNSANNYAGRILCGNSSPTINYNTISGNSAGVYGGGIYCHDSSPTIINTIFWGDSAPIGPEIYLYGTSSPVITYCDVQGGWEGETNIDCDPMFCYPDTGNYYLHANSCCVGAGQGGVDIGALGEGCWHCLYTPGDCNHNGAPLELGDLMAMISMYRGSVDPYYICDCGVDPPGAEFAATADPNGNCVALELGDVVTEIGAYRGTATASGCEDCPGSRRIGYGAGNQPVVGPTLKFKVKSIAGGR